MSKKKEFVTKNVYDSIEECKCGGPVFKYHDTSKNVFIAKCGYFKKIIDIEKETKKKIWIVPKKISCDWVCVYNASRPVFVEINKKISVFVEKNVICPHKQLEQKLTLLFKFLYVSNHTSTLDEINNFVKNNLLREPRKTFYYPTIGQFMRISHREPYEEYEKRIFSKKIIDQSYINYINYKQQQKDLKDLKDLKDIKDIKDLKDLKKLKKKKEKKNVDEILLSQFIIVDSEDELESESDRSDQADSDEDHDEEEESESEESEIEEIEEIDEIEENYDDEVDDDEVDYYDD